MKLKLLIFCGILVLVTIGCSNKISQLDTFIRSIEQENFTVDCSPKKQAGDDIGYSCKVTVYDDTILQDHVGNPLTLDDFKAGDQITLYLKSPQLIEESDYVLHAQKIMLRQD